MEYRLGNYRRIKANGITVTLVCPKCSAKTEMSLFSNKKTALTADMPFLKNENIYFLVCPACAAVFGVDEAKGDLLKKGEKLAIGNYDLKELNRFES